MQVRGSLGIAGGKKDCTLGNTELGLLPSQILQHGSKALITTVAPGLSASALLTLRGQKIICFGGLTRAGQNVLSVAICSNSNVSRQVKVAPG